MTTEQIQEALQDLKEHHKTHDVELEELPSNPPFFAIHIYWWCKSGELKYSNQCYGTSLPALFHEAKVLTKA